MVVNGNANLVLNCLLCTSWRCGTVADVDHHRRRRSLIGSYWNERGKANTRHHKTALYDQNDNGLNIPENDLLWRMQPECCNVTSSPPLATLGNFSRFLVMIHHQAGRSTRSPSSHFSARRKLLEKKATLTDLAPTELSCVCDRIVATGASKFCGARSSCLAGKRPSRLPTDPACRKWRDSYRSSSCIYLHAS